MSFFALFFNLFGLRNIDAITIESEGIDVTEHKKKRPPSIHKQSE